MTEEQFIKLKFNPPDCLNCGGNIVGRRRMYPFNCTNQSQFLFTLNNHFLIHFYDWYQSWEIYYKKIITHLMKLSTWKCYAPDIRVEYMDIYRRGQHLYFRHKMTPEELKQFDEIEQRMVNLVHKYQNQG
jgi:hypothetical protein